MKYDNELIELNDFLMTKDEYDSKVSLNLPVDYNSNFKIEI